MVTVCPARIFTLIVLRMPKAGLTSVTLWLPDGSCMPICGVFPTSLFPMYTCDQGRVFTLSTPVPPEVLAAPEDDDALRVEDEAR